MKYELSLEQRDRIMAQLTEAQRHFLHHELVRGRRTLFARQLARKKCQFIPEDAQFEDIESFIDEWDYIGFTDSGEVSPHTKCECGRSLRYQHQVLHLPTNTIRYFGIEHLQLHTGIDAKAIADIMKGFDVLDGEMNEVLCKFRDGWQLGQHLFLPLPEEVEVPSDIQAQIAAELPLLERQLARIRRRLHEHDVANRKKRLAAALTYYDAPVLEGDNPGEQEPMNQPAASNDTPSPVLQTEDERSQGTFQFGDEDVQQGAFQFGEADNGQAAFVFEESTSGQGAFVFDEDNDSQGAFLFDEPAVPPALPIHDADAFEEAGRKLGAAMRRETETSSSDAKRSSPFYLPPAAQSVVLDAIKYGRISTLAISNFLMEQKLVPDTRMSTGKPAIYIAVAAYLDKLAATGKCELVSGNSEDRTYTSL
ncbi:DUF3895 domain-containing protein [Paenibacillus sinopodophylli]|uniref:DUF3895 domain-containing protein n=1 Tax=Paenibacillus sinopodophylli TaxID=1837342 RepID=UPI00110D16B6|nr:DUF3895 domain-containing protein [Paenibacillus sinopodophylli]